MCNIRGSVIVSSISVVDLWVKAIISDIVVNNMADGSSLFGTSVGKLRLKQYVRQKTKTKRKWARVTCSERVPW